MRCLLVILLVLGLTGPAMAAVTGKTSPPGKDPGVPYVNPPAGVRVNGDTVGDPFILPGLPSTVTGTTTGFVNDYDEGCPYFSSTSPDVVYAYTAPYTVTVAIDLCYSSYDTKVYVYEDAVTPGYPLACNDDYWLDPPCYRYSSYLEAVPFQAGHTYYIVVDGYTGAHGDYRMDVDACCDPPLGACCLGDGSCEMTVEGACDGAWQGEDSVCDPSPCEPVPVVPGSWGRIKAAYR